jgi:hypothetical protein
MKKFVFPSIIAIYFIMVLIMTDLEFKKYDFDFIISGLGEIPSEIINSLLIIIGLAVISAAVYIISARKGGSKK